MFDQRGELPLLPLGNPIGPSTLLRIVSLSNHFVPASRGEIYIESTGGRLLNLSAVASSTPNTPTPDYGEEHTQTNHVSPQKPPMTGHHGRPERVRGIHRDTENLF